MYPQIVALIFYLHRLPVSMYASHIDIYTYVFVWLCFIVLFVVFFLWISIIDDKRPTDHSSFIICLFLFSRHFFSAMCLCRCSTFFFFFFVTLLLLFFRNFFGYCLLYLWSFRFFLIIIFSKQFQHCVSPAHICLYLDLYTRMYVHMCVYQRLCVLISMRPSCRSTVPLIFQWIIGAIKNTRTNWNLNLIAWVLIYFNIFVRGTEAVDGDF